MSVQHGDPLSQLLSLGNPMTYTLLEDIYKVSQSSEQCCDSPARQCLTTHGTAVS